MSQRFSDTEPAAEMWQSKAQAAAREASGYSPHYRLAEAETFHRFATLPHAHEPEPKTVYVYDESGRCIGNFPKPDIWTE